MESYTIISKLGSGAYSDVCKVEKDKATFALKVFKVEDDDDHQHNERVYNQETEALAALEHPNVVKLIETDSDGCNYWLLFELVECDLHNIIYYRHDITVEQRLELFRQLLVGVAYIHEKGFVHRDLKPSNILVTSDLTVKVADFGSAIMVPEKGVPFTEKVVTRWYRSPELIVQFPRYDQSIDIWSLGCIYLEIVYRNVLFPGRNVADQLVCIFQILGRPGPKDWPEIDKHLGERFQFRKTPSRLQYFDKVDTEFAGNLLRYDPSKRLTAAEALEAFVGSS